MTQANKKFWDSSEFTGAGQALEAQQQSAFLNMTTNATGYSYLVKARVITKPLPMSDSDAAGENNTPSSTPCSRIPGKDLACKEAERAVAAVEAAEQAKRFGVHKFFARIELEGASPSEHELISNVCSISTASDKLTTASNIGLHVLCYTRPMTTTMPKIGDTIRMQLRVGDVGRDLQHSDFAGLEQVSEISEATIGGSLSCQATLESTMKDIFDDTYTGDSDTPPCEPANHMTYTPSGQTKNACTGQSCTEASEKVKNAWAWLSPFLPNGAKMTSGIRTQEMQDNIIRKYASRQTPPIDVDTVGLDRALEILKSKGLKIARYVSGPGTGRGHGGGGALDISGADLCQIAEGINYVNNHSSLNVKFRPFSPTGAGSTSIIEHVNDAVHVEVISADPVVETVVASVMRGLTASA